MRAQSWWILICIGIRWNLRQNCLWGWDGSFSLAALNRGDLLLAFESWHFLVTKFQIIFSFLRGSLQTINQGFLLPDITVVYQVLWQGLCLVLKLFNLLVLVLVHGLLAIWLLNTCAFLLFKVILMHICEQTSPIELAILTAFRNNFELLIDVAQRDGLLNRDRWTIIWQSFRICVQCCHIELFNSRKLLSIV